MIFAGSKAPVAVHIVVSSGDVSGTDVDFSQVTGATITVRHPGGSKVVWTPTVSASSATSVSLTHVLSADGTDLPTPGDYVFWPKLQIYGGEVPCALVTYTVPEGI